MLEDRLENPAFVETMAKFVRASMKGWKWAEEHPDDAAMIVLDNDETGAQTEEHQKRMMGEIAKLTAGSNGALDPAFGAGGSTTILPEAYNAIVPVAVREVQGGGVLVVATSFTGDLLAIGTEEEEDEVDEDGDIARTTGDFDVLLLVHTADNRALRELVLTRIQAIPEVLSTRTLLVFEETDLEPEA